MLRFMRAAAAALAMTCAHAAYAAPALTTIQDTIYRADGTRFTGTVTITWNSFETGDMAAIGAQGTTVQVHNGALRAQLAPTTNATPGANYSVVYNSQGKFQFSETWAVPPSTTVLRIRDVRVATGEVVGPAPVVTSIGIPDVTGLANELSVRPVQGPGYAPSRAAVINALGNVDGASGNPTDCVRVDGSSGPCGTSSVGGSTLAFADGEIPSGLVNGVNTTFNLLYVPTPVSSVEVYRNGLRMSQGVDYSVSGSTITFLMVSTPQAGDVLTASYRYNDPNSPANQFGAPQVICSGKGQVTNATTATVLGWCAIPDVLSANDRIEIRFDYSHEGSYAAFAAEVDWGGSALFSSSGTADGSVFSGRVDVMSGSTGTQWTGFTWGDKSPWTGSGGMLTDGFAGPLTITFYGQVSAASSDTITLRSYTVIRYPAK